MVTRRSRGVRTDEGVQLDLLRGLRLAESIVGPTLGPGGTPVLMNPTGSTRRAPERIDDGATALRRVLAVDDEDANAGLMLARHTAWRVAQTQGDGTATAVVIGAAAHRALVRAAAHAREVVLIRRWFDEGARRAREGVMSMARPVTDDQLVALAKRSMGVDDLALATIEAVTRMGPHGSMVVRDAPGDESTVQFVDGAMWETRPATVDVLNDCPDRRLSLSAPAVLVWDTLLDDVTGIARLLERLAVAEIRHLLLVAPSFGPATLGLLAANQGVVRSAPVLAPMAGTHQRWALDDLAAIAGSSAFGSERGDRVGDIPVGGLGRVRRAIVSARSLDVTGPSRPTHEAQRQLGAARHLLDLEDDPVESRSLRERIGRLEGGMAIVWVGGRTPTEQAERRRRAESGLRRLAAVARGGSVPGGGSTLVHSARHLGPAAGSAAERIASSALVKGLQRPLWWIARNARLDPRRVIGSLDAPNDACAFDVLEDRLVDAWGAGLLDAAEIVSASVRAGTSAASLAFSAAGIVAAPRLQRPSLRP